MSERENLALLTDVHVRFEKAGVPVVRVGDYLSVNGTGHELIVRVMDDPGHPPRVHLRSVTEAGEVTVSTQRMSKLKSLIDYARVLRQSAARADEA